MTDASTKMATSHLQLRNYLSIKNVRNELSDSELLKRYCLEYAGTLSVTDLVRETLVTQICCRWEKLQKTWSCAEVMVLWAMERAMCVLGWLLLTTKHCSHRGSSTRSQLTYWKDFIKMSPKYVKMKEIFIEIIN